ncbi:MAG: CPBP family intramembrane metalloprotease [Bacteroidales bacterium]|nr:MAG: CPBP family intramembrane metalloprotease [Bacteroidales bacterium]
MISVKKILIKENRLRSGWRILLFFAIAFPPLYFLTYLYWEELLLRYFILFWLLLILSFMFVGFFDKRPISTIGFYFHRRAWTEYFQGVLIGTVLVSILFFFEIITGSIEVSFKRITISLLKHILVISLFTTFFQSAFEELFFRGYIFQNLIEATNSFAAIIIISLVFGAGHMLTPNSKWIVAINLSVFGAMHALAYIKTKSLYLASGLHFSWNYFMRNIYSLPVSGTKSSYSLFDVQETGQAWITGDEYGPEAGIPALFLMIICSIFIWCRPEITVESGMKKKWEEYRAKYLKTNK